MEGKAQKKLKMGGVPMCPKKRRRKNIIPIIVDTTFRCNAPGQSTDFVGPKVVSTSSRLGFVTVSLNTTIDNGAMHRE